MIVVLCTCVVEPRDSFDANPNADSGSSFAGM